MKTKHQKSDKVPADVTAEELKWLSVNLQPGDGSLITPIGHPGPMYPVEMPVPLAERFLKKRQSEKVIEK